MLPSNNAIHRAFRWWAKDHPNFMTPNIGHIVVYRPWILEVSYSLVPFMGSYAYGISVFKYNEGKFDRTDKYESRCFVGVDLQEARKKAYDYLTNIRHKIKSDIEAQHEEDQDDLGMYPYNMGGGCLCSDRCRILTWCPLFDKIEVP